MSELSAKGEWIFSAADGWRCCWTGAIPKAKRVERFNVLLVRSAPVSLADGLGQTSQRGFLVAGLQINARAVHDFNDLVQRNHALAAVLSGARVTAIRLLPSGTELGSVSVIPPRGFLAGSLSRTLTAFAPVFFGCLSLYGLLHAALPRASTTAARILVWYLAFAILLHMDLSGADFRAAAKGAPGFLALLVLLFWILLALFPPLAQAVSVFFLSLFPKC